MSDVYSTTASPPQPAQAAPPGVADASAMGTMTQQYALANHTHASKARKIIATTAADGTYTWDYEAPFDAGITPIVVGVAVTAVGVTDVINLQVEGTPTNTQAKIRVNRTQRSAVALLGLTILSVPSSPGATVVHLIALAP